MADDNDGSKTTIPVIQNAPPAVQPFVRVDNDPDIFAKSTPSGGVDTAPLQVDVGSIESAQERLKAHGAYVERLADYVLELKLLVDGPPGARNEAGQQMSALGSFPGATELKGKHDILVQTVTDRLNTLSQTLKDTSDSLGKIAANYKAAEDRNALTADKWSSIFQAETTNNPGATTSPGPRAV